jgi:hypothetical protein
MLIAKLETDTDLFSDCTSIPRAVFDAILEKSGIVTARLACLHDEA